MKRTEGKFQIIGEDGKILRFPLLRLVLFGCLCFFLGRITA